MNHAAAQAPMDAQGQVMVAISADLANRIGLIDPNHGRFVVAVVERELARRQNPPRTIQFVDEGFADWCAMLPTEEEDLVDMSTVTWIEDPT